MVGRAGAPGRDHRRYQKTVNVRFAGKPCRMLGIGEIEIGVLTLAVFVTGQLGYHDRLPVSAIYWLAVFQPLDGASIHFTCLSRPIFTIP